MSTSPLGYWQRISFNIEAHFEGNEFITVNMSHKARSLG